MTRPPDGAGWIALTRAVSPRLGECELTHRPRQPIDPALAAAEHAGYESVLSGLGCQLHRLPAAPDLPDAVFVEDTAVVLDEVAIVTRPGAASRRAEPAAIREALPRWRPVASIEAPGTLDGGDVLQCGRQLFIGTSARSDAAGIAQVAELVSPFGYQVVPVAVRGCLHLKSAATLVAEGLLLINPDWVDAADFRGLDTMPVHPEEPDAANTLRVGAVVVQAAASPRTRRRLEAIGITVLPVEATELAKAEAGVSCCSVIFPSTPAG